MKKKIFGVLCLFALTAFAGTAWADGKKGAKIDGKKEFEEHCAVCHAERRQHHEPGAKTLDKKDLQGERRQERQRHRRQDA